MHHQRAAVRERDTARQTSEMVPTPKKSRLLVVVSLALCTVPRGCMQLTNVLAHFAGTKGRRDADRTNTYLDTGRGDNAKVA